MEVSLPMEPDPMLQHLQQAQPKPPARPAREGQSIALRLVIPCYNEAKRFPAADFESLLSRRPDIALVLVDDGSKDGTLGMLYGVRARCPDRVKVLKMPRNQGKAEAVRQGLLWATRSSCQTVGYLDADLSAPLEEAESLLALQQMEPGADVALGVRLPLQGVNIQRSLWRRLISFGLAFSASCLLGIRLRDTQCGAKVFRNTALLRSCIQKPFRGHWLFDIEMIRRLDLAARKGSHDLILRERPLDTWVEKGGSSVGLRDYLTGPYYLFRSIFGVAACIEDAESPSHEPAAVQEQGAAL